MWPTKWHILAALMPAAVTFLPTIYLNLTEKQSYECRCWWKWSCEWGWIWWNEWVAAATRAICACTEFKWLVSLWQRPTKWRLLAALMPAAVTFFPAIGEGNSWFSDPLRKEKSSLPAFEEGICVCFEVCVSEGLLINLLGCCCRGEDACKNELQ